ncbi:hypothetical protein [Thalassobius sp. MITS945101]|uniref:hypothetical protein n=1 Tax=Thalassobius sp. MITS945101 TaxID=3096994 RepID=UPI00399A4778
MNKVLVDTDAVLHAARHQNCTSAQALKQKFGGGHDTWTKLLKGGPISRKFFERACGQLNLDPLQAEVHLLTDERDVSKGLRLSLSEPTVFDFRGQHDPRPQSSAPGKRGGKQKKTIEDSGNRLFLLFSFLELHAASKEHDIFVESVKMKIQIKDATQLFHPYRWCNFATNSDTNPEGYWLAAALDARSWTTAAAPEGFHLGRNGPLSIKEECSFVALTSGSLQIYRDLLDLLASVDNERDGICTLMVKFRIGDETILRSVARVTTFSLEYMKRIRAAREEEYGYAHSLQSTANI